jgi:hypothetical protein
MNRLLGKPRTPTQNHGVASVMRRLRANCSVSAAVHELLTVPRTTRTGLLAGNAGDEKSWDGL